MKQAVVFFKTPEQETAGWKTDLLTSIRQVVQELYSVHLKQFQGNTLTVKVIQDEFTFNLFRNGGMGTNISLLENLTGKTPGIAFSIDTGHQPWTKELILGQDFNVVVALLETSRCGQILTRMLEIPELRISRVHHLVCVKAVP